MQEEPQGVIPRVPFAFSDLQGIERVVWAYHQHLQKPPVSAKDTKRIQILQQIQERLAAQLASETQEVQLFLDVEELEELLQTMLDFATLIKCLFPKNGGRDSVITSVNAWRLRLLHIISEFNVP